MKLRLLGSYHKLPWGGGQITISKKNIDTIKLKNMDKLLMEYDTTTEKLTIEKL